MMLFVGTVHFQNPTTEDHIQSNPKIKYYQVYAAASFDNIQEGVEIIQKAELETSKGIKPNAAALIACIGPMKSRLAMSYRAYEKNIPASGEDFETKIVNGFYIKVNDADQARNIMEACDGSDVNIQDAFISSASSYGLVKPFTAFEHHMPFAEWVPEINEQARKCPLNSCLGPFTLAREGKMLVIVITKRTPYISPYPIYDKDRMSEFERQRIRMFEAEKLRLGHIVYPTQGHIFASIKVRTPSGSPATIHFTQKDLQEFQAALSRQGLQTAETWGAKFKRAIVVWLMAKEEGVLLSSEFQSSLRVCQAWIAGQKSFVQQEQEHVKPKIAFKANAFIFSSPKIAQELIQYLQFLRTQGASRQELQSILMNATENVGTFIKTSQVVSLQRAFDLYRIPKAVEDIQSGDLVVEEVTTHSSDDIAQLTDDGDGEVRIIIYDIQERVRVRPTSKDSNIGLIQPS